MWRAFQLGSTISKILEGCFKGRDTFMELAGRKKAAFITELFKEYLILWWKQFHTTNLKINPVIQHWAQFHGYYIKAGKKSQHEPCMEQIHFSCIFRIVKVCMEQHINCRKRNLLYLSYSHLWKIIHDPWAVNFCIFKQSVCISCLERQFSRYRSR